MFCTIGVLFLDRRFFLKTGNHGFYRIPRGGWGKMGIKQQISGIIVDQHGMADFSMASSPNCIHVYIYITIMIIVIIKVIIRDRIIIIIK